MTAIAYRDGVMAADSVAWMSGHIRIASLPKIIRLRDGALLGCAGSSDEIHMFEEWMKLHGIEGKPAFSREENFHALLVRPDGAVFHCWSSMCWTPSPPLPFIALGAAGDFMMGALAQGATAEQAVQHAIDYTHDAGGVVQVERLGRAGC